MPSTVRGNATVTAAFHAGRVAAELLIGIPVHAHPEALRATLRSLAGARDDGAVVVLLPDGPDDELAAALADLDLPSWGTDEPAGTPACLNRLLARRSKEVDVVLLLESGAIVGPGAVRRLLDAVGGATAHGLAGPSTNRSWNDQCVFPSAGPDELGVAITARRAAGWFGERVQPLTPLHSLGDFCLAIRSDVIEAVGAANEDFGHAPCWEMEYSARASRAGFTGVWVPGAYVHRAAVTARREAADRDLLDAGRRHYQDAVCGLRLTGERTGEQYEPHCRGEVCEHFAPPGLVRVRLPNPVSRLAPDEPWPVAARHAGRGLAEHPPGDPAQSHPTAAQATALPASTVPASTVPASTVPASTVPASTVPATTVPATSRPAARLVSCLMPTGGRRRFAEQAAAYFLRQDYPSRELIVVDDGDDGLEAALPEDERIRYRRVPAGLSIGAKRNLSAEMASGDIFAQWDDDDWYSDARLSTQVAPLAAGRADITGLTDPVFLDLHTGQGWRASAHLLARMFRPVDVHGGTLVYRREVWRDLARYPNVSLAEDAAFLDAALQRGARLERVAATDVYLYVRHGSNSWRFAPGSFLDPTQWRQVEDQHLPAADRAFYASFRAGGEPADAHRPLVSCVMPTRDRRPFVAQSIAYFLRQDYPATELLVVDDGMDPVKDLVPPDDRVRYVRLDAPMILGDKRNACNELAAGEVVLHWDDDDWASRDRVSRQVGALLDHDADVCGDREQLYYDPAAEQAWWFRYPASQRSWVAGNSLCYRRSVWARSPFPSARIGEDTRFVWSLPPSSLHALQPGGDPVVIGIVHAGNTSVKRPSGAYWSVAETGLVHRRVGPDLPFYRALGS